MAVALAVALLDMVIKAFTTTVTVTTSPAPPAAGVMVDGQPAPVSFPTEPIKSVIGVTADLVKVPAGIGAVVGLLGVSLLIGALVFGTPAIKDTVQTVETVRSSATIPRQRDCDDHDARDHPNEDSDGARWRSLR